MTKSTCSREDSLVNPSVPPGSGEARQMTATSGRRCFALSRAPGPLGSVLKTLLGSTAWHSRVCLMIWKAKTTQCKRSKYRLRLLVHLTNDSGLSFWPTITTSCNVKHNIEEWRERGKQNSVLNAHYWDALAHGRRFTVNHFRTGYPHLSCNPAYLESFMGYPIGWTNV